MKHCLILIMVIQFFCICLCLAQESKLASLPLYTKIGLESWSAGGTGIVDQGVAGAPVSNPAAMEYSVPTGTLEFGKRFYSFPNSDGILKDIVIFPEYISVGLKYDNLNYALGYFNQYNLHSGFSIYMYDNDFRIVEHSFFGSVSTNSGGFKYGFTVGINYVTDDESYADLSASGSGTGVLLIAGALYEPDERQTLGFTFRYSSPISYDLKPSTEPNVVKASSPWVIEGGYSILLSPSVKLLGSLEFQNWTDVGSNLHNKFQYHVGLVVKCSNSDELRFGTFSQYYPQSYDSDYPKYFITGGYQKTIGNTRLGISVLDNHISIIGLPGDSYYYDQTIISLGATYTFK